MPENEDKKIWAAYAKGVKPLGRASLPVPTPHPQHALSASSKRQESKTVSPAQIDFQAPLERSLERRMRNGEIVPEARLDLHGMREDEAHQALIDFIEGQMKNGRRYLLVITGKGCGGQGVLRARLKGWLAASLFAAHILALRSAAIRHGGAGAFYVLLKKRKK
jgi:DNA-nicking Smr family endonuclease